MRTLSFAAALLCSAPASAADLSVMTYNIWWGGVSTDAPLAQTAKVIRESGAQIVAIQEKESWDERGEAFWPNEAQTLRKLLEWDWLNQTTEVDGTWNDVAILSQLKIGAVSPEQMCAVIEVEGTEVNFCNIHLYSSPYQPYQLIGIEYRGAPVIETEEAAIAYATMARANGIAAVLAEIDALGADRPTIVLGDFNEPSHLDWTEKAAAAGLHPVKVAFPQSVALTEAGFVDAYRAIHPDEVVDPGFTWTPTSEESATDDHHDRIDFIYVRNAEVIDAKVLGEKPERADIVVTPWPSDHRAVMATVRF